MGCTGHDQATVYKQRELPGGSVSQLHFRGEGCGLAAHKSPLGCGVSAPTDLVAAKGRAHTAHGFLLRDHAAPAASFRVTPSSALVTEAEFERTLCLPNKNLAFQVSLTLMWKNTSIPFFFFWR